MFVLVSRPLAMTNPIFGSCDEFFSTRVVPCDPCWCDQRVTISRTTRILLKVTQVILRGTMDVLRKSASSKVRHTCTWMRLRWVKQSCRSTRQYSTQAMILSREISCTFMKFHTLRDRDLVFLFYFYELLIEKTTAFREPCAQSLGSDGLKNIHQNGLSFEVGEGLRSLGTEALFCQVSDKIRKQ